MTVSIIIAVKTWQKNLEECVDKCLRLDYDDFEIVILPDNALDWAPRDGRIRVIPTGPVLPARKRDIGIQEARGEIVAFLDDDAYPVQGWLRAASRNFEDAGIAAVGGPAVTPSSDSFLQQASGQVYESPMVSGSFVYRYVPRSRREIDDFPSCNLLVRKAALESVGGFNTDFWPGEDTKLCLDITKRLGKKIIYDPEVMVYHHRRRLFAEHLRQVASYALHRGYFVKRFPETSLRPTYFVPSAFSLFFLLGAAISFYSAGLRLAYALVLIFYIFAVFIFSIAKSLKYAPCVAFGTVLTHFTYGIYFLGGLIQKKLKEEQ